MQNRAPLASDEEQLRRALAELEAQHREVEHARSRQRAILDASSDAMLLVGPDGRSLAVNRRFTEMFDVETNEIVDRSFDELQPLLERIFGDTATLRGRVIPAADDTRTAFDAILAQQWPLRRELELRSTRVDDDDGMFIGRLYAFRDVTSEREIDRMKSAFVSLISYEIRTPLTSILGYVDLLLEGGGGSLTSEQREFLDVVIANSSRLKFLIDNLLDISSIEARAIDLRLEPLYLAPFIKQVAMALRPLIEAKGQQLLLHLPDALPPVQGDADRVTQILANILSNAHKFTPVGGTITVTSTPEDGHVRVGVRDTGIGIAAEERDRIFTVFYRSRNRTTREVPGSGLGLAITRALVEMQGGEIAVASVPGAGATFSFTLPVAPVAPGRTARSHLRPGSPILVVVDDLAVAGVIRHSLTRGGYRVLVALADPDALELARLERPDLIVLGILPHAPHGIALLERFEDDRATASIPIAPVLVLGEPARGWLLSAVDYVRTPLNRDRLRERVDSILADERGQLVLVAIADADTRRCIGDCLREAGYQVCEAAHGAEAIALARARHPHLALVDPSLEGPGVGGLMCDLCCDPATRDVALLLLIESVGHISDRYPTSAAFGGTRLPTGQFAAEDLASVITSAAARGGWASPDPARREDASAGWHGRLH